MLKCRWCDWSRPAWRTNKNGSHRYNLDRLVDHVEDFHPDEFEKLAALFGHDPCLDETAGFPKSLAKLNGKS